MKIKQIVLKIGGMSCSACSNGLEKYLNSREGIISASVNLVLANATIQYDENILNQQKIEKFVKQAGFISLGIFSLTDEQDTNKWQKPLFVIFSVLSVILLYISMGAMIGLPEIPSLSPHNNSRTFATVLLIITVFYLIYGFDILKSGYKNLIHRTPNMDTLVSVGVLMSFLYSIYGTVMIFKGHTHFAHNLYFESCAIVIFFLKLGRFVDSRNRDKTKEAIKSLVQITPNDAVILVDGQEKKVTIDEIKKGDTVVSRAGEKIAVDGTIINGEAHFDESFITGESKPSLKTQGDCVLAGSLNYNGYLEYTAEKIGKESTVSEIVRIVVEASSGKAPIARIADKISGVFVPAVFLIAILGFIGYLIFSSFAAAIEVFVTVLVVACPCSLGLAAPLAIIVAEGACAKRGILVKKSEVLETASRIDTVVFDKTGTLTYGNLKIARCENFSSLSKPELISLAAAVEVKSTHPISGAFKDWCEANNIELEEVTDFKNHSGMGIEAKLHGERLLLGNDKLLKEFSVSNNYSEIADEIANDGNSVVYVVKEDTVLGIIGVSDVLRDNILKVVYSLLHSDITPVMLTGDNEKTASIIAGKINIESVFANVLPAEKGAKIDRLKNEGRRVMMIGDGINDSPALAISDIGVSIGSGTDVAMNSADVVIMNDNLENILTLIKISRKTVRNIKTNLFWAFFYNCLMIPVALGVLSPFGIVINPMIAGLAMTLSSLTVILNALRLARNLSQSI